MGVKNVLRWLAGLLFLLELVGVNQWQSWLGGPLMVLVDVIGLYLIVILVYIQRNRKRVGALTLREKQLLLPGIFVFFPSSLLLAYAVLGANPTVMEDIWRLGKYAMYIFFSALIILVIVLTILGK